MNNLFNIKNNVYVPKYDEIKTELNDQLSFSPYSKKGHIYSNNTFHDFKVNNKGDIYSSSNIPGYDIKNNKTYIGNMNNMKYSPINNDDESEALFRKLYRLD